MLPNQIVKIDNPFEPFKRQVETLSYAEGQTVKSIVNHVGLDIDLVVLKNGRIAELNEKLQPGDVVHIYPVLQNDALKTVGLIGVAILASYVVGPYVSAAVGGGLLGTAAGAVAGIATVAVGGMLLNSNMSTPTVGNKEIEDSPTYQWDIDENIGREGLAIPVIYGNVMSYPYVINQWIDVNSSGKQISHSVFCVAEGETNNEPTDDEIYVNEQLLSAYDSVDYTLVTTDGGASPSWGSNTDFTYPHQMRKIDQQLTHAVISSFLLNFNGTHESTTIEDSSTADNNWTCEGGATLTTINKKYGTASLNIEDNGKYVSCDNEESFNIWTKRSWCFECWIRQNSLNNLAIIGQERVVAGGDSYYWGLFYDDDNDKIRFQQYKKDNGGNYTIYYNLSLDNVGLETDKWYHVLLQKEKHNRIYIGLDGDAEDVGGYTNDVVDPPAGTWAQAIGKAQFYDSGTVSDSTLYGRCKMDDARLVQNGQIYQYTNYDDPDEEITESAEEYIYTTQGSIDAFGIVITAPYGIYKLESDGSLDDNRVDFWIFYRKSGESEWTTDKQRFGNNTRNPYRERYDYNGLDRGVYEIKIRRTSLDQNDTRYQSTTLISYIDEYLEVSLTYPYLQCIGLSLKAQDEFSGTIPKIRVESNRNSILVPIASGGNETVNPTVNAYAAKDVMTNSVYGGGIDVSKIIDDDLEDWSDYCQVTLEDNQRCQFNMIFDSVMTLDEALQQIEVCGRARTIKRGAEISFIIDQPGSPVALFGTGNIVPESDHVKWLRAAEKADVTEISYRDIDLNYAEQTVPKYSSGYHSLTRKPRVVRLSIPGINNKEQAEREALLRQQLSDSIKRNVVFESGLEAIPIVSGDVINYQSSINSFSGRLPRSSTRTDSWTGTDVFLDQEINLDSSTFSGNCVLMVRDPDDTLQTYTVTGPFDTDTWYVTISASNTFNYLSPFTICRSTGDVYQYKINKIFRSNNLDVKIEGSQYDSTAYYNAGYEGGGVAI